MWQAIRRRCYNANTKAFPDYGGRGVRMCERWRNDFSAFIADVGARPSKAHTLDRIDNDGHYEPGNVQWATRTQQANNRRSSRLIEFRGETRTLAEWSRHRRLSIAVLHARLNKLGWSLEKALTTPRMHKGHH